MERAQPLKVLFIAGAGRSGSTIIEKIVGGIDGVVSLGEVSYLWKSGFQNNQMCGCGKHFHDCEFWQTVKRRGFPGDKELDPGRVVRMAASVERFRHLPFHILKPLFPYFRSMVREYAAQIAKVYYGAAATANARILIDSSKRVHGHILAEMADIDLCVVHLVRDGRATAYSWTRAKVFEKRGDEEVSFHRFHPMFSTLFWCFDNISAELLLWRCKNSIRVRYEDFARDPRATLRRIFALMNEPNLPIPVSEELKVNLTIQHSVSGNPVRFEQGEATIREDNEWKTGLSSAAKLVVTGLAWPLLWRYGYFSSKVLA